MTTDQTLTYIRSIVSLVRKAENSSTAYHHKLYCEGMISMASAIGTIDHQHRISLLEEVKVAEEVANYRLALEEQDESI